MPSTSAQSRAVSAAGVVTADPAGRARLACESYAGGCGHRGADSTQGRTLSEPRSGILGSCAGGGPSRSASRLLAARGCRDGCGRARPRRSASASIPSRREAGLTTSLRRATEASGTRRRGRVSSAGSTRRPGRRGTPPSEPARRRTVSSSAPTERRGSPTAVSTRSSGSTRRHCACAASRCPRRRPTPT